MDAAPQSVGRLGYVRLEPAGIVAAISPFNHPGDPLAAQDRPSTCAAGNATILKPSVDHALTATFLVDRLQQAGLPDGALQLLIGPGASIGPRLVADPRVRRITFTGSYEVGEQLARVAGAKRIAAMELGSNAAMVVSSPTPTWSGRPPRRLQRLQQRRAKLRVNPAHHRRARGI